jgi:hypothetical protein
MKKMLNEGNQIHNFISSSGSGSSSGSTSQKATVHTVPVPQRCLAGVLLLRRCPQTAPRTLGTASLQDCCCWLCQMATTRPRSMRR